MGRINKTHGDIVRSDLLSCGGDDDNYATRGGKQTTNDFECTFGQAVAVALQVCRRLARQRQLLVLVSERLFHRRQIRLRHRIGLRDCTAPSWLSAMQRITSTEQFLFWLNVL